MLPMTNLFLNTAIISNQSSQLGNLANICLAPFRYLFHGRTVEIWNKIVIHESDSVQKHWTKTAAAIVLLVPGLLMGIMARFLDHFFFQTTRADFAVLEKFDQNPFPVEEGIFLDVSHARLDKMATVIKDQMCSKSMWKNRDFISQVTSFMEAAYQEIEMFFEEIEERYEGDPARMARAMAQEGPNDKDPYSLYFPFYFYGSLTEMYHYARSCAYLEDSLFGGGRKKINFPSLIDEDQDPYFTSGTPQFHWRQLYNDFCDKLNEIDGLCDHLKKEDERFINWAQPDKGPVKEYGFPDTRPTVPVCPELIS